MQSQQQFEVPPHMMYSNQPGQIVYPDQMPQFLQPQRTVSQAQLPQRTVSQQMQQQHSTEYPVHQQSMYDTWTPVSSSPAPAPARHSHHSSPLKEDDYNALLDDEDDDDLNVDTSNMTQEEKNDIKHQRKLRKMNREKLKRAKLNNQFDHLSQMLSMGRSTRVEKLAVLNEAIRNICHLKAENDGLRIQKQQITQALEQRHGGTLAITPKAEASAYVQQPRVALPSQSAQFQLQQQQQMQFQKMQFQRMPFQQHMQMKQEHMKMKQEPAEHDNHDLDFAFGDSGSDNFWEAEDEQPERDQSWNQQFARYKGNGNMMESKGFPNLNTDDSVDMFLDMDGDGATSDLLCFS